MARTVIVTGANGSMGSQACEYLAGKGWDVIMACRTAWKGEPVAEHIRQNCPGAQLRLMQLDLCRKESIEAFVQALKESGTKVDALFNNAGILAHGYEQTEEGFESAIATNLIGTARLTESLLPLMSENARIVNMVSLACHTGRINDDIFSHTGRKYHQIWRYSDSKLGLMLYSLELQERLPAMGYPGICVDVADPGIVDTKMIALGRWFDPLTDVLFRPVCNSPMKGVTPALHALEADDRMRYYVGKGSKEIPQKYINHPRRKWLMEKLTELL